MTGQTCSVHQRAIELYLQSSALVLEEIRVAQSQQDRVAVARAAHKLKGASANVYAGEVTELATRLEEGAATDSMNRAQRSCMRSRPNSRRDAISAGTLAACSVSRGLRNLPMHLPLGFGPAQVDIRSFPWRARLPPAAKNRHSIAQFRSRSRAASDDDRAEAAKRQCRLVHDVIPTTNCKAAQASPARIELDPPPMSMRRSWPLRQAPQSCCDHHRWRFGHWAAGGGAVCA